MGKWQNTRNTTYKRTKRSTLSQQVIERLQGTDGQYDRQTRKTNNKKDPQKEVRRRDCQ